MSKKFCSLYSLTRIFKRLKFQSRYTLTASLLSAFLLSGGAALACTWAAYHNGKASVVARTMDWFYDDNMVAKGHGRGIAVKTADTPNALTYTSKYASLQMHSFNGLVTDAMNEKGLQASALFLEGSEIPAPLDGRSDVSCINLLDFFVSNFATVQEAVNAIQTINILPPDRSVISSPDGKPLHFPGRHVPFHLALADIFGDKAVIEFWEGELRIYHGGQHDALSNEPHYEIHLASDASGYQPNGSIAPIDRRARARLYMQDMIASEVVEPRHALLAMRGLLASVWAGTDELDPVNKEAYPTIWGALIDQNALAYYISRYNSWCTEKYDFTMFDPGRPEAVTLKAPSCPLPKIEISGS